MTVGEAIRAAAERLAATSDTARLDAELLMAHALGLTRSDMLLKAMRDPAPESFAALVERRAAYEPVAYITGWTEFYGRRFDVAPGVLIPRSDSETLIDAALERMPDPRRVLDLGTGSGALLFTILLERPQAAGVGIDASQAAIEIALGNGTGFDTEHHLLDDWEWQLFHRSWREDGWADDLGTFDLILCNPPYVEDDAPLDRQVREFEPASALFAGPEGLDDYRILIPQMRALMNAGALAVLEIGANQADAVAAMADAAGFATELRRDLAGRPRALLLS
jgi:release factor glutamine methyltransferase